MTSESPETTSNIDELLVDLEATVNYVRGEITEQADKVGFEDAVALLERLERVKAAVGDAISLLTSQQLKLLEKGSKQIGTRIYASVPKTVKRTDHAYVRMLVAEHALGMNVDEETGVISAKGAISTAIDDMMKLYVSPAKNATITGLKRIGAKVGKAHSEEDQGRKIQVVDLAGKQAEEDDDDSD